MGGERRRLPTVLIGTVMRVSQAGEPHGLLYRVDLETGDVETVYDAGPTDESFSGRGGKRGLRGIAFAGDAIYVGTFDTLIRLDRDFAVTGTFTCPYLADTHELCADGGRIYIASTAYDSVLVFDPARERFVEGICFRNDRDRIVKKLLWKVAGVKRPPALGLARFDPEAPGGPRRDDVVHLNNVHAADGVVHVSTLRCNGLYRVDGDGLVRVARLPVETHNARPFEGGALMCATAQDRALCVDSSGRAIRAYPAVTYPDAELENDDLPPQDARKFFMRGLAVHGDDTLIAGQSPATVTAYDIATGEVLRSVCVSKDVRNTVHGLAVWPEAAC